MFIYIIFSDYFSTNVQMARPNNNGFLRYVYNLVKIYMFCTHWYNIISTLGLVYARKDCNNELHQDIVKNYANKTLFFVRL